MAQPAHPQPQDDFPFFLLRIILAMTATTMIIKTPLIMIVAIFPIIHVSIGILLCLQHFYAVQTRKTFGLFCEYYFAVFNFRFVVSFVASL